MSNYFGIKRQANTLFGAGDWMVYFSPGRINLIGEHIDYNGGYVLPCSLDLGITGAFKVRADAIIQCRSMEFPEQGTITFSVTDATKCNNWTDYVKGILLALGYKGGFDLLIQSTLPVGAGLSSSASLELLVATFINDQMHLGLTPIQLALISQQVENKYIGVQCGIMDQFAVAMGTPNHALLLDTKSLSYELLPLKLDEVEIVIANTNKSRALAESKYNERRSECEKVLQLLKNQYPITHLCELPIIELDHALSLVKDEVLKRRFRHVVTEHDRTLRTKEALLSHNKNSFGVLLNESHESLRDDYQVSCYELDTMVDLLREHHALGARMTGAGFGGCAIALMKRETIASELMQIEVKYYNRTHLRPTFYRAKIGGGAKCITFSIDQCLSELTDYALNHHLFDGCERTYRINQLLGLFALEDFKLVAGETRDLDDILDDLTDYAIDKHLLVDDSIFDQDQWKAKVMDCVCESPKMVMERFYHQSTPEQATSFLYDYAKASHYIQTKRIESNISWIHPNRYGHFIITINMSKPEKDPKMIARLLEQDSHEYPKCQLCIENEGFQGTSTKESRQNMRLIPITLKGDRWYFQYSPYSYYHEHAIVLDEVHTPMVINRQTFEKLIAFLKQFPHYFVGSNADLPIVGGSILNHNHFQCGKAKMPIEDVKETLVYTHKEVKVYRLDWPLSTIRLVSSSEKQLIDFSTSILEKWQKYENKALNIVNSPILHNTITPISRFGEGEWIMDLILRNNFTTEALPLGVFHPRPSLHHIKKENIGLIEAMGLAILPSRLKTELQLIQDVLVGKTVANSSLDKHQDWIRQLKQQPKVDLYHEVGEKFTQVLEDAGVFKQDTVGIQAFIDFINSCK